MTTDTAPPKFRELADNHLYGNREFIEHLDAQPCGECPPGECQCAAPAKWLEAAAMEAYTAFTERIDTWVETLIAGRPYDTPLVEWEHRELDPVAEMLAEHGRARRELGESLMDTIPWDDAKEVAQQ